MPLQLQGPTLGVGTVYWDIHVDQTYGVRCGTPLAAVKLAFGLRPRAREDELKAQQIAKKSWPLFELIGREAITTGRATLSPVSKSWRHQYDIDAETFTDLFERFTSRTAE